MSRVKNLARRLDTIDPQWVCEIELSDPQPILAQVYFGWLEDDHPGTLNALALAAAEAAVFAPWGEAQWREEVEERQLEDQVGRVVRATLNSLTSHYAHPDDPNQDSPRTALCGDELLCASTPWTSHPLHPLRDAAAAGDWKPLP